MFHKPPAASITSFIRGFAPVAAIILFGGNHATGQQSIWAATKGPYAAEVRALVIKNKVIHAGTRSGLFVSTDNGAHWSPKGLANEDVFAVSIGSQAVIHCGTYLGLFRSTDHGDTWSKVAKGWVNSVISVDSLRYIFAGFDRGGILRSTDNGVTWARADSGIPSTAGSYGPEPPEIKAIAMDSSHNIYAATYGNGIYRTSDYGQTWKYIGLDDVVCFSIAVSPTHQIFVGSYNYVFYSTDFGTNWNSVKIAEGSWIYIRALLTCYNGYTFAGTIGNGVFRSTDNGKSWSQTTDGLSAGNILSLTTNDVGDIFAGTAYADFYGGVFRSTNNGATWMEHSMGLGSVEIYRLLQNSIGHIFASSSGVTFRSTNDGNSWSRLTYGNEELRSSNLLIDTQDRIFAWHRLERLGSTADLLQSTDNGVNWSRIAGPKTFLINRMAINSKGHLFATWRGVYVGGGVFYSSDGGKTWTTKAEFKTNTPHAIFINSQDYVFLATQDGILRSTDEGGTWVQVGVFSRAVCLAATSNDHIYAGTRGNGVYRSTDNGKSWSKSIPGPYGGGWVESLAVNFEDYVLAGTLYGGIYMSTDRGNSWKLFNIGFPSSTVWALMISPSGYAFAGNGNSPFNGFSVYRTTRTTAVPTLASPSNSATVLSTSPTITWNRIRSAESYRLQLSKSLDFSKPILDTNIINSRSFSLHNLAINTTYYWRVNSIVGNDTSFYSDVWSFTTPENNLLMNFPLPNRSPYTAEITSVFDHSMEYPYHPDSAVVAYTGEEGRWQYGRSDSINLGFGWLYGFMKSDSNSFLINRHYLGGAYGIKYLEYDNHPGFDFRTKYDANADGQLQVDEAAGIIDVLAAASGRVTKADMSDYGTIKIDHGNSYTTTYVHLSQFRVSEGDTVLRGQVIGRSGGTGKNGNLNAFPFHLHFEAQFAGIPIDPYGWEGFGNDPYEQLTGIANARLWHQEPLVSVPNERTSVPNNCTLDQNYPNPFNPTTAISFSLPARSYVTLKVFDVLGREVSTLASEELPAGRHTKQWKPESLSSGVYFYRLQADSFVETKKAIFVR